MDLVSLGHKHCGDTSDLDVERPCIGWVESLDRHWLMVDEHRLDAGHKTGGLLAMAAEACPPPLPRLAQRLRNDEIDGNDYVLTTEASVGDPRPRFRMSAWTRQAREARRSHGGLEIGIVAEDRWVESEVTVGCVRSDGDTGIASL